jgi:hypothetical protein
MGFKLSEGQAIQIGKDKYDVLRILEEIDKYDTKNNKAIGEHLAIDLHKHGDISLHPTHLLEIMHDSKGRVLKQTNKKIIARSDIKER